jgi:hypothetical protein
LILTFSGSLQEDLVAKAQGALVGKPNARYVEVDPADHGIDAAKLKKPGDPDRPVKFKMLVDEDGTPVLTPDKDGKLGKSINGQWETDDSKLN